MATKKTAVATKPSTAMVDYKAQLAALAGKVKKVEEALQPNSAISFKSGAMSYMGAPIKGNTMPVCVIDSALENAFYDQKFDPDKPVAPVCFAFGTGEVGEVMAPHPDSEKPQAETCAKCPQNVFGTADTGKGKACKNQRKLALIHGDIVDKNSGDIATTSIARATLSPMNAPVFSKYALQLAAARDTPPLGVISQMTCVPDAKSQFKIEWAYVHDVPNAALGALLARQEEAHAALFKPYQRNAEPAPAPAKKAAVKGKARKY